MRPSNLWRWRQRNDRTRVTPRWMAPLPTSPVRFDPALHTAAELVPASQPVTAAAPQRDAA